MCSVENLVGTEAKVPLITIGITCHNAAETIRRAIGSALKQDWPSFEVVAVDDCSTDDSWAVLERTARGESRLRIVRHDTNRGYPGALNSIIDAARGQFVAIFDDDDESMPNRLSAQWERITAHEQRTGARLIFCYSNRSVVEAEESHSGRVTRAIGRSPPEPYGVAVADYLLGVDVDPRFVWGKFGSCTLMAHRSAFLAVGPFDESFRRSAELDMAVRGAMLGAHFIAVDRSLITQYKTRSADKSGNIPLKYALHLRSKHRDYLEGKRAYLASRALAHAHFHGNKGHAWRGRFFILLALLLAPHLAGARLRTRRQRRKGADAF